MTPAAPTQPAQPALSPRALKQHERWRKLRGNGRWHFILARGVGFWGGLMFLAMWIGLPLLMTALHPPSGTRALTPVTLAIGALLCAVGGVAFGLLTWHFSEKKFSTTQLVWQGKRA